jgi:hypothetical protein
MKKNKLLPILLLAGAGFAAFMYFKNKSKAKEITDGIDVAPDEKEKKESLEDQKTVSNEESEPVENKTETYIKKASDVLKTGKQLIRARKIKRLARRSSEPKQTASSMVRKNKRLQKKAARTAKRTARKSRNKVVTGFEF